MNTFDYLHHHNWTNFSRILETWRILIWRFVVLYCSWFLSWIYQSSWNSIKNPFKKNPQEEEEPEKKEDKSKEPETKEENETDADKEKEKDCDISPLPSPLFNLDEAVEELDEIDMMIQSHHHKNNPQSYGAPNSAFRQSGFHQVWVFIYFTFLLNLYFLRHFEHL